MEFSRTKKMLAGEIASGRIAGACALVCKDGDPVFCDYEGYTGADGKIKISENSAFRLASMTKPITATAVLLCAEKGLLGLSRKVRDFIPGTGDLYVAEKRNGEWVKGEKADDVTLFQLLTHSSGVGCGEIESTEFAKVKPGEGDTLATTTARYGKALLAFRPGTAQAYSPVMGFDLLARVVEVVSGISYGEFLKREIFAPLRMNFSSYLLSDFRREDLVSSCSYENGVLNGSLPETNFGDFPVGYTGGSAGLVSTLGDYGRFANELLRCYRGGEGILSRESAVMMGTPQLDEKKIPGVYDFFNWGLGVRAMRVCRDWQPLPAGSYGWSGAYGTHFWVDPENGVTAVYMHNSATFGGAGAPHTLAFERAVTEDLSISR